MVSKAQALRASTFTSTCLTNRAKKPELISVRASGACKTWKTRPDAFKVPIKYGLRESAYLTNENAHEWTCALPEIPAFRPEWRTDDVVRLSRLFLECDYTRRADTASVLADALTDAGADDYRVGEARGAGKTAFGRADGLIREILDR